VSNHRLSVSEQIAGFVRYMIIIVAAVALLSEFSGEHGARVHAATPVAAAPSYISFTAKANATNKFYITDTDKTTICVYTLETDKLRLVSVRKFDADSKIMDGTIKINGKTLEGVMATRNDAEQYAKNCQPILEKRLNP